MNSTPTLAETAGAPETASASDELVATANLGALQSIWSRFAPGVVAVILAAGLSAVGWLMARQIANTDQNIMRLENRVVQVESRIVQVESRIVQVESNLRADIARVEGKIDSLLTALATDSIASANQ